MSKVKSFSVGNGDMFYIKHDSDSFTIIDCSIDDSNKESIVNEIKNESKNKGISRFISTHPDEDHIKGLEYLNEQNPIRNFYCVENEADKEDKSDAFKEYCKLRDDMKKSFYLYNGCTRRWLNKNSDVDDEDYRGSAGISVIWPNVENKEYKKALEKAKEGDSPNNISPIFIYRNDFKFMWMGDMETSFLEKVKDEINFEEVDILIAPHHGRKSGRIPNDILNIINPQIIIIGEASSENLDYYRGYSTITQNSAGDITFDVNSETVEIYVGNSNYSVDYLENKKKTKYDNYIGSLIKR